MYIKHGKRHSTEYRIWLWIKQRCYNKNNDAYNRYGERWILMCEEWKNNFQIFYNDMWDRPEGTTLDRINNNLWYFKKNCRWATKKEQQNNRYNNVICIFKGVKYSITDFASLCLLSRQNVRGKIWDGFTCEEIVEQARVYHERMREISNKKSYKSHNT